MRLCARFHTERRMRAQIADTVELAQGTSDLVHLWQRFAAAIAAVAASPTA